jgi:hypothetical protein
MPARNNVTKFISYLALVICTRENSGKVLLLHFDPIQAKIDLQRAKTQVNNKWKDLSSNAIKKIDNGNV